MVFPACPHCGALTEMASNRWEQGERMIPATQFWLECTALACRATGPCRPTPESAAADFFPMPSDARLRQLSEAVVLADRRLAAHAATALL